VRTTASSMGARGPNATCSSEVVTLVPGRAVAVIRGCRVRGMQEFSSISVSSYEADTLAARLTEQSRDGWSVVAIVPTGSTVVAYLSREANAVTAAEPAPAAEWTANAEVPTAEPAPASEIVPTAASAVSEPAATEPVATVAATAAAEPAAAGGAPAGWYADPSSRFELRYWDGGQWTEHVSRAGQQYTDPPVA
jgi:hypothetical protein